MIHAGDGVVVVEADIVFASPDDLDGLVELLG